ncbi:MAG TPA: DUF4142 domain-containing protein [Terricaulis sp.]|nr:DUF4142 domain-containing protein [Terricaulis sp.]
MSKYLVPALGVLALAACGQQAQQQAEAPTAPYETPVAAPASASMTPTEFVQAAANADAFKLQSSQLAATRAARADVKELAATIERESNAASQALAALAPTISVPAPQAMVTEDRTDDLADLRGKTGAEFDDAYLDDQVEAHNDAIQLYENYVRTAEAGPLRTWAESTLATLRTQRDRVQALENAT